MDYVFGGKFNKFLDGACPLPQSIHTPPTEPNTYRIRFSPSSNRAENQGKFPT